MFRVLLVTIFSFVSLSAEILETAHFKEILSHLEEGTLVIFDIDNTLIEPVQLLGSDQWFEHRIKYYHENGHDDPVMQAFPDWAAVQALTKVQLVEGETAELVHKIQERGYLTLGLTSRSISLSDTTHRQLKSVGIDLYKSSCHKAPYYYEDNHRGILFQRGILFCSGTNKGAALIHLLEQLDQKPTKILFVDDKKSALLQVEAVLDIPYVGFRYGFLDEKVKQLNEEVAHLQWDYFNYILSDHEAHELVQ